MSDEKIPLDTQAIINNNAEHLRRLLMDVGIFNIHIQPKSYGDIEFSIYFKNGERIRLSQNDIIKLTSYPRFNTL